MTLGEKIKSARLDKGLTQKQLGELCGMADSAIRRYELGGANPKIETLRRIADALEVPLSEFSDNFIETPDFRTDVYGTAIKNIIYSIKYGPCHLSKEIADELLKELKSCIKEGEKIKNLDELSDFYWKAELNFSHKILHAILNQYSGQSVYDIVDLLNYYLALCDNAQNKIQEYAMDLYEIPIYREN